MEHLQEFSLHMQEEKHHVLFHEREENSSMNTMEDGKLSLPAIYLSLSKTGLLNHWTMKVSSRSFQISKQLPDEPEMRDLMWLKYIAHMVICFMNSFLL